MVQIRRSILIFACIGACLTFPMNVEEEDRVVGWRQRPVGGPLGAIGTALVPIVGAVIGPILTNLANGISNAFTNGIQNINNNISTAHRPTRPIHSHYRPKPSWDAYVLQVPGIDVPYMLLTQEPTVDRPIGSNKGNFRNPTPVIRLPVQSQPDEEFQTVQQEQVEGKRLSRRNYGVPSDF